jgi:hypothetical protein
MMQAAPIAINLTAAILAMRGGEPVVYAATIPEEAASLPSGPFEPLHHRTLEIGLRHFVQVQAGFSLGYVEQLYTFGDRGRHAGEVVPAMDAPHIVSIGYLALTRLPDETEPARAFKAVYRFFPWEDWRKGEPAMIGREIRPRLLLWAEDKAAEAKSAARRGLTRAERVALLFGNEDLPFDEEKVLERYELLYEAGLVEEAARDGREAAHLWRGSSRLGEAMAFDHRRILATALGRLRAKLKYRPVIFEMMPPSFTLTDLQKQVEAIAGHPLHKQNFRRLVETSAMVEATGGQTMTKGRPAALFRFRHEVMTERPTPGLRLGRSG